MLAAVMLCFCFAGCKNDEKKDVDDSTPISSDGLTYTVTEEQTDFVCITMEDGGRIVIQLRPDVAPITVANFKKLVSQKFYDGLIFHRVIKNYVIQCGDPEGTGMGGSDEEIKGEFSSNGVQNNISHERGVISMARSKNYDSASSQFFICHKTSTRLDGDYAAFGNVVYGMETVDKIAETPVDYNDKPVNEQKIASVRFCYAVTE